MTKSIKLRCKIIITIVVLSQAGMLYAGIAERISSASKKLETKADRLFIKGEYPRAMKIYEQADSKLLDKTPQKLMLDLKMARLYTLLQQPSQAIKYYDIVHNTVDTMLTVSDVCFFLDALRQTAQDQKAEIIARRYAFKSPYSRNQRYMNTLYALSHHQHYYDKGDSDYAVKMLGKSTPLPEYWVGTWNEIPFYAVSHSPLQDPLKIFYHRTQYFSLNDENMIPFKSIPRELQSGPVAFSKDKKRMVATGISYRNTGRIINPGQDRSMYVTQLYYSQINSRSGGWSRFIPLFEHQEGYSYAHPTFFNNGRSLIFSSDRPGGLGGMDLYISNWNDLEKKWSDPLNLSNLINTEGDEVYPQVVGDYLYFSSNGHEGFGGYDIYRIGFNGKSVEPGTLFHYSYPINTSYNDFGAYVDGSADYFISDRRGSAGKDDIYTFDNASTALGRDDFIGVSEEHSAMAGKLNIISGMTASNSGVYEKELVMSPVYVIPEEGELLLSIYFDFNRYQVDMESLAKLNKLIADRGVNEVKELAVIGYADEFGSQSYNQKLSEQRAEAVARVLTTGKIKPELFVEGRGQLSLSPMEYQEELQQTNASLRMPVQKEISGSQSTLSFQERIKINRKARRVDIIVKKK